MAVFTKPCQSRHQKDHNSEYNLYLSRDMGFPTMWYVRPTKPQISLRIHAFEYYMSVKLLAEHNL